MKLLLEKIEDLIKDSLTDLIADINGEVLELFNIINVVKDSATVK